MSHPTSALPLEYLIRLFEANMAPHDNQHLGLNDKDRRALGHRMLLDEQQRRLESRRALEASIQAPVCPYYSTSGHSNCWWCHRNGNFQPSEATENLLRSLTRPQYQPTPTSGKTHTTYMPSSASTIGSNPLNQIITPRSSVSSAPLTDERAQNQPPNRRLYSSKPAVLASAPALVPASTPLAVLTQPKVIPPPLPYVERPVDKDFVPVTIPTTFSHFLQLPLEIRNSIYSDLVHNGIHGLLLPKKDLRIYHQAPITRVNRQIRQESVSMVYRINPFDATNRELVKQGPSFARHVPNSKLTLIRNWRWFTVKRHLSIEFDATRGGGCVVGFDGQNDEAYAIGQDRCNQVLVYLNSLKLPVTGLEAMDVVAITEIVLRTTPKTKTKTEDETAG
ncbi:hypothetical protein E4T38_08312 [Aureobasidium subglaciale]|nr:hypothetical protein E4T38_08312 [Aureobasidium subglaciale]